MFIEVSQKEAVCLHESKLIFSQPLVAAFAAPAAVNASPFPDDIAANVAKPTGTSFYGKLKGNHQPAKKNVFATGGIVTNPNLAVSDINNNDGIGPGTDNYRLYTGDGTTGAGWPDKGNWVSYVDMYHLHLPFCGSRFH